MKTKKERKNHPSAKDVLSLTSNKGAADRFLQDLCPNCSLFESSHSFIVYISTSL